MPFTDRERALLLRAPRIGPGVLERLQAVGVDSLAALRSVGVDLAVSRVCQQLGTTSWSNRRRALRKALEELTAGPELRIQATGVGSAKHPRRAPLRRL